MLYTTVYVSEVVLKTLSVHVQKHASEPHPTHKAI